MIYTSKSSILCGIAAVVVAANVYFPGIAYGASNQTADNHQITVDDHFVLSGVHTDQFQLNSNNTAIFNAEGIVPGDTIEAVMEAENTTDESLNLALISIKSQLKDTALFDALELTIKHDEEVVYDGFYKPEQTPMTDYITVEAGETIFLDISVAFPEDADNNLQNKKMSSSWLFEAKHAGSESDIYPEDYPNSSDTPVQSDGSNAPGNVKPSQKPTAAPDNTTDKNTASNHTAASDDKDGNTNAVKTGVELIESDLKIRLIGILGLVLIGVGAVLILRSEKKEN